MVDVLGTGGDEKRAQVGGIGMAASGHDNLPPDGCNEMAHSGNDHPPPDGAIHMVQSGHAHPPPDS